MAVEWELCRTVQIITKWYRKFYSNDSLYL